MNLHISINEFIKYTELNIDEFYFKNHEIDGNFQDFLKNTNVSQKSHENILIEFCDDWLDENYYESMRLLRYYRSDD